MPAAAKDSGGHRITPPQPVIPSGQNFLESNLSVHPTKHTDHRIVIQSCEHKELEGLSDRKQCESTGPDRVPDAVFFPVESAALSLALP